MQLAFNAPQVQPSQPFETIPPDWYPAVIVESEPKLTRDGTGGYAALTFQILDGPYKGRKLFTNLNIWNQNPTAVEIAYRDLSAICHSVGVLQINDTALLHNRPMEIKVTKRPARTDEATGRTYDEQNEVKGYRAVGSGAKPAGAGASPFATAGAAPSPGASPFAQPPPAAAPAFQAPAHPGTAPTGSPFGAPQAGAPAFVPPAGAGLGAPAPQGGQWAPPVAQQAAQTAIAGAPAGWPPQAQPQQMQPPGGVPASPPWQPRA